MLDVHVDTAWTAFEYAVHIDIGIGICGYGIGADLLENHIDIMCLRAAFANERSNRTTHTYGAYKSNKDDPKHQAVALLENALNEDTSYAAASGLLACLLLPGTSIESDVQRAMQLLQASADSTLTLDFISIGQTEVD